MRLAMTLLVRNEADIVEAQLAFHLNAGVDVVVATDNGSDDGTLEILERYERAGHLHLLREVSEGMRQSEWVTRMARLAATELEADWVINSDADEFWWPRGGTLKDVLVAVPERFGIVRGAWRHFVPRPDDERSFAERMTVRLSAPASPGDKATIYHAHQKVAHRAEPDVVVAEGNHDATAGCGLLPLRGWYPIEVLHFSFRSLAQFVAKTTRAYEARTRDGLARETLHHFLAYEAWRTGRAAEYYGGFVADGAALAAGLENGTLAVDTRLRDALRAIEAGTWDAPGAFRADGVDEDASYLAEISPLVEIDGLVRAERRVEALETTIDGLERPWPTGLVTRAGRLVPGRRLARR